MAITVKERKMKIDFTTSMTFYEFLAICLAFIGILIPIVQVIWKKWVVKTKLNFFPNERVLVYFNQSGPYIRIDGVYEAENKSTSIRNISLKIVRCRDEKTLNFTWGSFISPVNQLMSYNIMQTTEAAHPFKIESDNIVCLFTEFCDLSNTFSRIFKLLTKELFDSIKNIKNEHDDYIEAYEVYTKSGAYLNAINEIKKDFFWSIGEYDLFIKVKYGNQTKTFKYKINLEENDYKLLLKNIDESLLTPLKYQYGKNLDYYTATIKLLDM